MGRFQKRAAITFTLFLAGYGALIGLLFLAIQHHFDTETDDTGMLVVFLILFPGIVAGGIGGIHSGRQYDAACLPDAKISRQQPDLALALKSGESLALVKKTTRRGMFFIWCAALGPISGAINMSTSIWDHPILSILAIFGVLLGVIGGVIGSVQAWRQTISADDDGITVKHAMLPQRQISWSDIQSTICTLYPALGLTRKNYLLSGRRRILSLDLASDAKTFTNSRNHTFETLEGGGETYAANIQRLLVTLVARTHTPVRNLYADAKTAKRPQYLSLTPSDVNALPMAPAHLQPQQSALAVIGNTDYSITLHPKPPHLQLGLIVLSITLPLIFLSLSLEIFLKIWNAPSWHLSYWIGHDAVYQLIATIAAIGVVVPLGQMCAVIFYRQHRPILIATSEGLVRNELGAWSDTALLHPLHWDKIEAWAVMAMPDKNLFVVYGDGAIYPWYEKPTYRQGGKVQGDRRDAYHKQADQLHAMIALKTGLVLHEIPL